MICKNCGNEINENAKFCPKCGAPVEPVSNAASSPNNGAGVTENESGSTAEPQKRRRFWIPIVIIVVVVVIVLIVLAATGVLTKKKVKLDDYVSVEFAGYDEHGTAEVSLDLYELGEDYDGKIKLSEEANAWGYYSFSELIEDIAAVSVEPDSNLSNGDEVTVDWAVDLSYFDRMVDSNVELSYDPKTFEVTDLEQIDSVDVFDGVTVEFSGASPEALASVSFDAGAAGVPEDAAHYLDFSLDKKEGLAIGDTVTVTLDESSAEDLAQDFGMYPAEMTKDYEVEDIPYYVSSLDQIPEDAMEKMKQQADDDFRAFVAQNWDAGTLTSLDYLGSYFLYAKNSDAGAMNIEYLIYKYLGDHEGEEKSGYWYCAFNNGMILPDGTFSIDYTDYTVASYSKNLLSVNGEYFYYTYADGATVILPGYEDLDSMFNNIVTAKLDSYTYESTVEDQ